jgi:heme-degrading monooxygenase HmoA
MAQLPPLPYYAVIFTSTRTGEDEESYGKMAEAMDRLAAQQEGYLGIESVTNGLSGITVSYWKDEKSIIKWKKLAAHDVAQTTGKEIWYQNFITRVSKVERHYDFEKSEV